MHDIWKLKYGSHSIQIENKLTGKRLYVDGVLQDEEVGLHLSSRLFGKVKNEEGEFEDIKVSIGCSLLKTVCRVFIGERLVYSTDLQWDM
ncbi:hypothetical protein QWY14_09190 [Planococcus sp. N028]|uniref:Uncharacterized protein n=1 Tax=Planococcus shixiaomingii TaxID=3058393 RepID=A0ABT8N256_9BACL|nr:MULTISPECIES: hypothetical protein [unclassified Planococcus (in: firmicutes)]MDN7241971.1 hypothetical protein [Planococcus sp. N028]WKA54254.1 hypothetical protein QWY21_16495 [Planococcus sp. N022]